VSDKPITHPGVPLSQPLARGTVGQSQKARDSGGTESGTADLKALARLVIERDSQRDCNRDRVSRPTHSTEPPSGTADAWYLQGKSTDTSATAGAVGAAEGGGGPHEWTEGFALLQPDRPPADVPLGRWRQFIADARRLFGGGIVAQAAAAGWTAHDLFGCDDTKPYARVDQMGLLWLVEGGLIASLSMSAAVIETPAGVRQTYRRKDGAPGRVLVWELFGEGEAS
jgi:hypothetical protein